MIMPVWRQFSFLAVAESKKAAGDQGKSNFGHFESQDLRRDRRTYVGADNDGHAL